MLKLRMKIAQYQEQIYLVFILSMVGLISMGFNSTDKIYLVVFGIAALALLLKMAVTDYTLKEFLWITVFSALIGIDLLRNGEKTLLLTIMGIWGVKNVSLEKIFRYALWTKIVLTAGTLTLAATGIIENEFLLLPKNDTHVLLYCYGYLTPNIAFANLFLILVFAILVYRNRLKLPAYLCFTLLMLGAYELFMCRTGLVVWFVLLLSMIGYWLAQKLKWEKIYLSLFCFIPIISAILSFALPILASHNETIGHVLDYYLTGRLRLMIPYLDAMRLMILGNVSSHPFDNMYFHTIYNYGWIIFVIGLAAYIRTMWLCMKQEKHHEVIILGIMALYGFMENYPLSVVWNLSFLYLSLVLFNKENS